MRNWTVCRLALMGSLLLAAIGCSAPPHAELMNDPFLPSAGAVVPSAAAEAEAG